MTWWMWVCLYFVVNYIICVVTAAFFSWDDGEKYPGNIEGVYVSLMFIGIPFAIGIALWALLKWPLDRAEEYCNQRDMKKRGIK